VILGKILHSNPTQAFKNYGYNKLNVKGSPVMDCYPFQGRVVANNATETAISSDGMDQLAQCRLLLIVMLEMMFQGL